jgi:hypothetical protein
LSRRSSGRRRFDSLVQLRWPVAASMSFCLWHRSCPNLRQRPVEDCVRLRGDQQGVAAGSSRPAEEQQQAAAFHDAPASRLLPERAARMPCCGRSVTMLPPLHTCAALAAFTSCRRRPCPPRLYAAWAKQRGVAEPGSFLLMRLVDAFHQRIQPVVAAGAGAAFALAHQLFAVRNLGQLQSDACPPQLALWTAARAAGEVCCFAVNAVTHEGAAAVLVDCHH